MFKFHIKIKGWLEILIDLLQLNTLMEKNIYAILQQLTQLV